MNWIPLAIAIIVFVTSCIGLGYLAGFWVRRRSWPGWVSVLMAIAIACLWPAIAVGAVIYTGRRYVVQHPGEVNDAPAMLLVSVIYVGVPFLFSLSLPLALIGSFIARRRGSNGALR
jgi:ABC-type spermidine/putrescine transport system permease subunit II